MGQTEVDRKKTMREIKRTDCKILSMPLGPKVVFTKSAIAMAPTNDDMRALSPLCTSAFPARTPSADISYQSGRSKGR